ncbi:MAG: DUF2807 domain-containing protein [Flavobacteriales bacterium]|nr:DUF2807 domain-containing protein [Flavobacteriales bacterium]
MNKASLITSYLIAFLLILSCSSPIQPQGEIDDKEIELKTYDEVELSGRFRTIFIEDSVSKVRIESFTNIIENLNIEQNGFKVKVSEKESVDEGTEIYNVYIHTKNIKEIYAEDNVFIDTPSYIRNNEVLIELNDDAKMIAELYSEKLELSITDNADANLKGSTVNLDLEAEDNSSLKAPFFVINEAEVYQSGMSESELNVKNELTGKVIDNSKLTFIGNPSKDVKQKDLATIEKKD